MNKIKKILIPLLVIFIISLFIYINFDNKKNNNRYITSGTVEMDSSDISFQTNGVIHKIFYNEGNKVKKDNIIASLDKKIHFLKQQAINSEVEALRSKYLELKKGFRKEDIQMADLEVKKISDNIQNLKKELSRAQKLFKNNAISEEKYDKIKTQFTVLNHSLLQAKEKYNKLKYGYTSEQIEFAKSQFNKSIALEKIENVNLEYCDLKSPIDGILEKLYIDTGEFINMGKICATIINPNNTYIRAYIPANLLGKINIGKKVSIISDSFPNKKITGTIYYIANSNEFTPKSVYSTEERLKFVYMIKIRVINTNTILKKGMPVSCILEV